MVKRHFPAVPFFWLVGVMIAFYALPISDSLQTGGAVASLIIAGAISLASTHFKLRVTPLTGMVAALWGLALISAVVSEIKFISFLYVFFFGAFPLSFFIFSSQSEDSQRTALAGLRLVMTALAGYSVFSFFFLPETLKFGGTHLPFADNNSLGAFLSVGCLLSLSEAMKGGKGTLAHLLSAVLLFAAMMTTEGRAVMLAFGFSFALMVFLSPSGNRKKVPMIFFVSAMLLLAGMVKSDLSIPHWFTDGAETMRSFETQSADKSNKLSGSRFMMWKSALRMIEDRPFFGGGIGTFFMYYPEYRNPFDDSAGYMAHNDFLQLTTDMGVLAPLLCLLCVGYVLVRTRRALRDTTLSSERKTEMVGVLSALVMLSGHSLVNFNFYVLPSLMTTGLCLAVWMSRVGGVKEVVIERRFVRESLAVFGAFVLLMPILSISVSEYEVGEAIQKLSKEDVKGFASSLQLADDTGFGLNGRAYLQAALFAKATGDEEQTKRMLLRIEQVNPRIVQAYIEWSKLYLHPLNDGVRDTLQARIYAQKAVKLDPASIPARMQFADVLEAEGDERGAYEMLKPTMRGLVRTSSPQSYYKRIAALAEKFGDADMNRRAKARIK